MSSAEVSAATIEEGGSEGRDGNEKGAGGGGKRRRTMAPRVPHLQKELCAAVVKDKLEMVRKLLEDGADPSTPDDEYPTFPPIFLAAQNGHDNVIQVLIDYNADPNQARTDDGSTPLYAAVQNGHSGVVNLLLEHNANPNTPNNKGQTPLETAVNNLNLTMAASLVAHGAFPTTTESKASCSSTASSPAPSLLYLAAEAGELDLVGQLLKCAHGVEPPTTSGRADVHVTPIDIAKHNNHTEVVKLLTATTAAAAAAATTTTSSSAEATLQQALPPHITVILTAESSLLFPLPPAVLHWLQGGDCDTPSGEPHYDLAKQATEWLVKVVQAAHLSPRIKHAGRKLMACFLFTAALGYLKCWSQILIPTLTATLKALGMKAKGINASSNLAAILTTDHILAVAPYNLAALPEGHATPRRNVRQDVLMPLLTAMVSTDFNLDWKAQPEHIYVHVLLLIATALNPLFGTALEVLLSELEGVEVHNAAIKSFTRMINKLMTSDDHRYVEQKPRPAMNIDIVRRLVSATTPEAVLELVKLVAARFGGLSHLKCLPELAATNPAAADARYHMLPVMVTVVFAPDRVTIGSLLVDPKVRAAWAKLRATRPSAGVSSEQWQLDHDTAVHCMTKCDPNEPAKMHCEVQTVTTEMAEVRHNMHEGYKMIRASDGAQLHADVAKPEMEEVVDVDAILRRVGGGLDGDGWGHALLSAAYGGRIVTVKRLLEAVGGESGGVNVNWQRESDGTTAVLSAAANGHLSVVLVLLEHGADSNIARTTDGGTPMCKASENGFFEVVRLLLEHNTDPNKARTDNGSTPLFMAAQEGHLDIITALVDAGGLTGTVLSSNGATDLWAACWRGHSEVVQYLLAQPTVEINRRRSDARGVDGAVGHPGTTPLEVAVLEGYTAIADLLKQHGAD